MNTAFRVAIGAALACALGLVARQVFAPERHATGATTGLGGPNEIARITTPPPSARQHPEAEVVPPARRCLALAEQDPLAAMEMALARDLCAEDPGLLPALLIRWAERDFAAAHEWTFRQEPGDWRDHQLARLAYLLAQTDPPAAARLVLGEIPPGPRHEEAVLSVLHQWALRAPAQARVWADGLATDTLRRRATAELAALARADG